MDIELRLHLGKWGTNEITFNVVRYNHGTSKFNYCISYITFNCFSIIIIFKCGYDFWNIYGNQIRQIAPRTEPLETSIEVQVETRTDWRGQPYKTKVIKEVDNQDQSAVG